MIEISGVHHRFGKTLVLDDFNLRVESGSIVGLVGPNGAGKTTLLRAIATLLAPSAGTIRVSGYDTRSEAQRVRRVVGYLPERAAPYLDLAAWEYLDFFAEIAGHHGLQRRRRVDAALAEAHLTERRNQSIRHFSKGLRQRLSLQSVLMHEPTSLALDEPLDGLDPQSRNEVSEQIAQFARNGGAVIFSSHVLDEINRLAERTVAVVRTRLVELKPAARPQWTITVRGELSLAQVVASGVPTVRAVRMEGSTLHLELEEGMADASQVVSALADAGLGVVTVSRQDASLHELYHQVLNDVPR